MTRLPRDISGGELAKKLKMLGYSQTRQTGSHIRLSTLQGGEHHVTIPNHSSLRIGTLSGILEDISDHFRFTKGEIVEKLFNA